MSTACPAPIDVSSCNSRFRKSWNRDLPHGQGARCVLVGDVCGIILLAPHSTPRRQEGAHCTEEETEGSLPPPGVGGVVEQPSAERIPVIALHCPLVIAQPTCTDPSGDIREKSTGLGDPSSVRPMVFWTPCPATMSLCRRDVVLFGSPSCPVLIRMRFSLPTLDESM